MPGWFFFCRKGQNWSISILRFRGVFGTITLQDENTRSRLSSPIGDRRGTKTIKGMLA